jgi:hypothetical protein
MTFVQRDLKQANELIDVWYDGAGGALENGYCVCYDPAEALTHAAGEWAEQERWKTVQKPATANLSLFAGVVVDKRGQTGTTPAIVQICTLKRGNVVEALTLANMTIGSTMLECVNGQWYLDDTVTFSTKVVALPAETANTSGGADNAMVFGLL